MRLIYKNLKGDITLEEFNLLNRMTVEDTDNATLRLEVENAWDASGKEEMLVTEQDHINLFNRITKQAKPITGRSIPIMRWISGIAAILIMALGGLWIIGNRATTYSEAGLYSLDDNSEVILREGSILEVASFRKNIRSVSLDGEAYFNVTSNPEKPFIVTTNDTRIEVLGTSFLVKESEESTYVDLREGTVKFTSLESNASTVMTTGMKAVNTPEHEIKPIEKFNNLTAWKDEIYEYKNLSLSELLEELELIFDVEIKVTNPLIKDCSIIAILTGNNISDVLSQLAGQLEMKVTGSESKWILSNGKCK
jgi:ferric-dicitrate binding protein FerR (iron transport regulator)